jgi:hypothetical protein
MSDNEYFDIFCYKFEPSEGWPSFSAVKSAFQKWCCAHPGLVVARKFD